MTDHIWIASRQDAIHFLSDYLLRQFCDLGVGAVTSVLGTSLSQDGQAFDDITLLYSSAAGDIPITDDWIGQGHDGVGFFRPATDYFSLKKPPAGRWNR